MKPYDRSRRSDLAAASRHAEVRRRRRRMRQALSFLERVKTPRQIVAAWQLPPFGDQR